MRRTPTPEDTKVLRYAGFLGHLFAMVTGEAGDRSVQSHQNDDKIDKRYGPYVNPMVYQLVRFKTRRGGRWRRVR